jgi:hypothetical protein
MIKNVENREHYKRTNNSERIMKERVKKEKNRIWKMKCREVDDMVGGSQSPEI